MRNPDRTAIGTDAQITLCLLALTLLVFGRLLGYGFVYFDDNHQIFENPFVRGGLTLGGLRWAFLTDNADYWHPLAMVSHMIDISLFGMRPRGHHLTSVALHALNVVLVFRLLRGMTADAARSAFVAAVFCVHPLQVESVAWIAERKTLLSSCLLLLALHAYVNFARRPSPRRLFASAAAFAASLAAKPLGVALPALLLLLDVWPLRRTAVPWRRRLIEKWPFCALAAASCAATLASARYVSWAPWADRLSHSGVFYLQYLGKILWPVRLAVFYPYPKTAPNLGIAAGAWILLLLITGALARQDKRPWLGVGWLWFLAALFPMIGLVAVGAHSIADRFAYLPIIGLSMLAAWGLPARGLAAALPAVLAAGGLAAASCRQLTVWSSSAALFERAVSVTPDSALLHVHLGFSLFREGRLSEAIIHYRHALELQPDNVSARYYWGIALVQEGDLAGADEQLSRAQAFLPRSRSIAEVLAVVRKAAADPQRPVTLFFAGDNPGEP